MRLKGALRAQYSFCGSSEFCTELVLVRALPLSKLQVTDISHRDGNDGSWSSFTVQLGSPPQAVRLLPSITGDTIWAVLPQACQDSSVKTCGSDRGGIFTAKRSSTWEELGSFQLPLNPEHYLPFTGAAEFGFDNVTLDWQGYGGMSLGRQIVAGYITEDFYLGVLGLSPLSVNITSFNDQYPSFVGTLKAENHIPSNSYGYTAGASYRSYPVSAFGSLTLGGYDSTRMDASKNLTIVGGSDTYRPLLMGIEKITSGSIQLLDTPIITALDSIVSQIWLPISACKHFESAFGLVWDSTHELYIVNETQHSALLSKNASIIFTLSTGSEQNKDARLDITLPYAAFDLTAKPPYAGLNDSVRHFPLKQAANDTQYTLGRTFLQETYMIADYDRAALSLFPAVFPDSSIVPHLVPVTSPENMPSIAVTSVKSPRGLSRAALIGIVVAVIILLVLMAAGALFYLYRNRREKARRAALKGLSPEGKVELAGSQAYGSELEGHVAADIKHELASPVDVTHELASPLDPREWKGSQISSYMSSPRQEMPGDHGRSELCAHRQVHELP